VGYHFIPYTIQPVSLQNDVTVRYNFINQAHTEFLEFFNSDHPEFPNSVRAKTNTTGTYSVFARAEDSYGTTRNRNFNITVSVVTYPISITIGDFSIWAGEETQTINYTITPTSLQNTALVTYSYTGEGLIIKNSDDPKRANTITAAADAAEGPRIVTATVVNPVNPDIFITQDFTVTINRRAETTKDLNDHGGQTIETLANLYDSSALNCNVQPIDNIATFSQEYLDSFILGVDMGSIIEVEQAGGKFYDNDGYRTDVFEILSYYGINWVRIRLWNDPYSRTVAPFGRPFGGGTNDLEKAIEISKRAKKWGMKVLLNFHYSDFWAHPGQQVRPRAWREYNTAAELAPVLKQYTKDVLYAMQREGVLPDMVQVGNETNWGFCGFLDDGPLNNTRPNEKMLFRAGLEAVREISAEFNHPIQTMLHAADGMGTMSWWFNIMRDLDFDILGLSFYPHHNHGSRADFQNGLLSMANNFRKPIILVEYSVPFTTRTHTNSSGPPASTANMRSFLDPGVTDRTILSQAVTIRNFHNDLMNYTVVGGVRYGIGSFWWECAWLPVPGVPWARPASNEWYRSDLPGAEWESSSHSPTSSMPGSNPRGTEASKAFFSYEGTALPSLNAFLQMMGKNAR
jgi:arabinogalactan endo-1,4-beta-galactosidase